MNATIYAGILITIVLTISFFIQRDRLFRHKLQFTVLVLLTDEWISGRDLYKKLGNSGIYLSYGSFYSLMRELTDAGMVIKQDTSEIIDGETLKLRQFRLPKT